VNRIIAALMSASLLLASLGRASADERQNEQLMLDIPTAAAAQADAIRINAESHYAGTPGDLHIAQWMRDELAKAGFQAKLETFDHDVPYSRFIGIEQMPSPGRFIKLKIGEEPIPEDPDGTRRDAGPPFNAWSGSGVAIANVVDAGHGSEADYQALLAHHIDVRTRIALVRYGREFRGNLAKRAQDHGASGVIFFSDPSDRDGSRSGAAYPAGPYRPLGSVQRGALSEGVMKIPVLPVNANVAQRILATMPNGISTLPYRLTVEMNVEHNARLWNTIGILPGEDPTHMVVVGAHRDAWVYGVTDNGSGISVVLGAARALGYLYKSGWRPRYSIVLAGFDGEEIGEVGSQAYVRMHRGDLQAGCIAYINEDEITTGQTFGASAADALAGTILPATESIPDPAAGAQMLFSRWSAQRGGTTVRGPGGGSDFEPFLYELGIPIMQVGFGGIFGVYHSGFDDLRFVQTQADPGFVNHRAIAQLVALMTMRLADGDAPYHLTPYAATMRSDVQALAGTQWGNDVRPLNAAIDRYAYRASLAEHNGMDGNVEITAVQRLDKFVYGRNGYAAIPLPMLSTAIATGNEAAVSAAVGSAVHELDDITKSIAAATMK
jgi:N-acetylated-alpha-linked acidic dipeptidase